MNHPIWATMLALGFIVGSIVQVFADNQEQLTQVHQDWLVRCNALDGIPPCDMVQYAINQNTNEQAMRFSVAHAGSVDQVGVQFLIPNGAFVAGDLAISVDGIAVELSGLKFTRCSNEGCFIETVVEADALNRFRLGSSGVLTLFDSEARLMRVPLSFAGFKDALREVEDQNRKWAERQKG